MYDEPMRKGLYVNDGRPSRMSEATEYEERLSACNEVKLVLYLQGIVIVSGTSKNSFRDLVNIYSTKN